MTDLDRWIWTCMNRGVWMSRYNVGDYIVHESSGVCQVVEISEMALSGRGSEKMYYSLEPVYQTGAQVITPVESKVRIRDVHTKDEMQKLMDSALDLPVVKEQNVRVDSASWSAKLPQAEQERLAEELIAKGGNINFIKWEAGSVLSETGRAMEHMASFDYGYKIAAVRDWLFEQSK